MIILTQWWSCKFSSFSVYNCRNQTGIIKYPLPLKKCHPITFTAMTMCYATDGKTVFRPNSTQAESPALQVVLPLPSPPSGHNGSVVCELVGEEELYRNCTLLLSIPPYDCGCDGGYVDTYELNTTCAPLQTHATSTDVSLNCTAPDFTPSVLYRASCKWNTPNSPTSNLYSDWSYVSPVVVLESNLTKGRHVPRPPFPLWVIILSAVFLAFGLYVTLVVVLKRWIQGKRAGGYTTIQ